MFHKYISLKFGAKVLLFLQTRKKSDIKLIDILDHINLIISNTDKTTYTTNRHPHKYKKRGGKNLLFFHMSSIN